MVRFVQWPEQEFLNDVCVAVHGRERHVRRDRAQVLRSWTLDDGQRSRLRSNREMKKGYPVCVHSPQLGRSHQIGSSE